MDFHEPHIWNLHIKFSQSAKFDAIPTGWTNKTEAIFKDGYLSYFANHFLA